MARTLSERIKDPFWWLEQAAHTALGGLTAVIFAIPTVILAAVVGAFWIGAVREFEQRPIENWADTVIDLAFTVLGGLAVGLIIWGVA
jgi:hypothetical protein